MALLLVSENWFLKYKMWESRFDSSYVKKEKTWRFDGPQAQDEPLGDVVAVKLNPMRLY